MRLLSAPAAASLLALAACSSNSDGGGIDKDPAAGATGTTTTTTGTGSTTTTSAGDTSTGSGAGFGGNEATASGTGTDAIGTGAGGHGGGPAATQNTASHYSWANFQGEFDSLDQEPREGYPPFAARRLLGCTVDAPASIGERVVYLERTTPESEGPPDRQFLLSFVATEPGPLGNERAMATVHRLIDPSEWSGQCVAGVTLPMVGPVTAEDGCQFLVELDNEAGAISFLAEGLTAACVIPDTEASEVTLNMVVLGTHIRWNDVISSSDGSSSRDPESPEGTTSLQYYLVRRTPHPEEP